MRRWGGWLWLLLATTACRDQGSPPAPSAPPAREDRPSERVAERLHLLGTGALPDPATLADLAAAVETGGPALEAAIDRLLRDERFANEVAPRLVMAHLEDSEDFNKIYILKKTEAKQDPVYYLRRPCDPGTAERVHPWWDRQSTVLVCPDAHRPERVVEPRTKFRCGANNLHPNDSDWCGCGRNLMTCVPEDLEAAVIKSLRHEVTATIGWVVAQDLPVARAFTQNETIRDAYAEFVYQRWRVHAGELREVADLAAWKTPSQPIARHELVPGQHAGVLTTPHVIYDSDTVRPRQRDLLTHIWCAKPQSKNATTEAVLGLGATDLRDGEGWKKLAAMPLCTDCHARLDYGMQFFAGYPNHYQEDSYLAPPARSEPLPMYVRDIEDFRGTAPPHPRGFAELAVKQPEFAECMVGRVSDYVFGHSGTASDRRALAATFAERGVLRAVMREALLRQARAARGVGAAPVTAASAAAAPAPPSVPRAPSDLVPVSAALRDLLDERCIVCHAEGDVDLTVDRLPRSTMEKILTQTAFRGMPRSFAGIDGEERRRFVEETVSAIWQDAGARQAALAFHLGAERPPQVIPPWLVSSTIRRRVDGYPGELPNENFYPAGALEGTERLTSTFAAETAFKGLAACRGRPKETIAACLEGTLDPRDYLKAP